MKKLTSLFLLSIASVVAAEGTSARPNDFFAWGSFIYWQPIQENMSLGVVSDNSASLDVVNGKEVDFDFDFEPGFKVGLGYHFAYDRWDTSLEYTYFRFDQQKVKSVDPNNANEALFPAWQIPTFLNSQYDHGKMKWTLDLDLFDWVLAKECCVNKHFTLSPSFGVRGARLDQKIDVDYTNTDPGDATFWPSTSISHNSDSWGVGPRFSLLTNWFFGRGFRAYAEQELDILYTTYDLKTKQESAVSYASRYIVKQENAHYLRTHVDLDLGLGWGTTLGKGKYRLDLSADYSFQVFFNQNTFRSIQSEQSVGKSVMPNGNLYLNGLRATLRFDF